VGDFKVFVLGLLQFIQDSISEAASDQASRNALLSEADKR
jgi:hypothetical protein